MRISIEHTHPTPDVAAETYDELHNVMLAASDAVGGNRKQANADAARWFATRAARPGGSAAMGQAGELVRLLGRIEMQMDDLAATAAKVAAMYGTLPSDLRLEK